MFARENADAILRPAASDSDFTTTLAARTLHSVLLFVLPFSVLFLGVGTPLFAVRKLAASVFWATIVVSALVCKVLLKRGYVRLSGWIFVSTVWLLLALCEGLSGGIRSAVALSHIPVIVISVWLLGRREAIGIGTFSLAFGLSLAILETRGVHLPEYFPNPPVIAWAFGAGLVGLTILPLANVHRALVDSAALAQRELKARLHEEQVRAESDERFRATFFQAAVGIAQFSSEGRCLLMNDRLCEILGRSPLELRGLNFLHYTHPDDREASVTALRRLLAGEISSCSLEKRYIRKDRGTVWARVFIALVRDPLDQPHYFISVVEDITEKMQAEQALRETEERLTLAQKAAGLGVWDWDPRKANITICETYAYMHGLPIERTRISLEEWLSSVHPDDRERMRALACATLERPQTWDNEFRVVWPDGSVHWLRGKGCMLADDSGRPVRATGVCMDITERRQAEDMLRTSQRRLELAQAAAGIGCYEWDYDANVGHCSDRFPTLYGLPPSESGPSIEQWLDLIHPDDRTVIREKYVQVVKSGNSWEEEFRVIWPDGSVHWLFAKGTILRDEKGNPRRSVGVNMDVTARKRAEEESVARQKLEGLGVVASGIAHDFNNMLCGILAESELLLDETADHAAVRVGVSNIMAVANRATEIVRELLAYAGKEQTVLEPVDLSRVVREILQLLKVSISKLAALHIDLPEGLPYIRANSPQMAQVVMNLIMNASEALQDKPGVISVTIGHVEEHIRLAVSDNGCGMTEEVKTRIFDPFFTTKFTGRGMGLAAVQGIVRNHGGTINVASTPGQGSIFTILLPSIGETELAPHADASFNSENQAERNAGAVLVVEDEEPLRLAVSKMLRKTGFQVMEAGDGHAAVDLFLANGQAIDAVLLDMTLPSLGGREVLQELRRIRPDLRVILTTAYSQDAVFATLGGDMPWEFIRKPYHFNRVAEVLRNACNNCDRRGQESGAPPITTQQGGAGPVLDEPSDQV